MDLMPARQASFFLDSVCLLPLSGHLVARISRRYGLSPRLLLGLALAGFWGVSGGLYADLWNFPFLGEAGRGNHFMWNSGMELVGLSPWFRFSRPTYQDFFRVPNLTALFLFLVIYPLGIYAGFRLGDRHG